MGIIEPCKNPMGWNSPILPVKKKNGDIRLCANFKRTINMHLSESSDKFQLPVTEPLFQEIGKNKYFASFDVRSSYWQLKIREQDRFKTAFQFENQCYKFVRLPYGLKNSGDLFCRVIAECFKEVKNTEFIKHFVDDILCHTKNFEQYVIAITEIFEICLKYNICLNGSKCSFLFEETKFLGRIIKPDGYSADPENINGILEMNPPRTRRELQQCLGRYNWLRAFLSANIGEKVAENCFSSLIKELTVLNKKKY